MNLNLLADVLRKRWSLRRHETWARADLEAFQAKALVRLRAFAVRNF